MSRSTARVLQAVDGGASATGPWPWLEVLAGALRPEFRADVYFPVRGEAILFGHVCAVGGCPRRGNSRPQRSRDDYLCMTHGEDWIRDGRRPLDEWLAGGVALRTAWKRRLQPCAAAGCERSRCCGWWCACHCKRWIDARRPTREHFAASAAPAPVGDLVCDVGGCAFPAVGVSRLCDAHKQTHKQMRYKDPGLDIDGFLAAAIAAERRLVPHYDFTTLDEPLRSELRFAVQQRLDDNRHALDYRRVIGAATFVQSLGITSLLDRDHDWWDAKLRGRGPGARGVRLGVIEVAFVRYARVRLGRLRDHAYGVDPYAGDVWLIEQLGFEEFAYQPSKTISFTAIDPVWLRELIKRWARWRLRAGTYTPGTVSAMATHFKTFSDFLHDRGEPLRSPEQLTRGLLEDYQEHIARLGHSRKHQHTLISAMKVLLGEVRANGWEPRLPPTAAYYNGELPKQAASLPRSIDEHVMTQIEAPENIARLPDLTTRTAVSLLIKTGLRTVDATRLAFDPVVTDAAGAPVLLYYNHKLKRDAALPIDDVLLTVIRDQQDALVARYPDGTPWLLPSGRANAAGREALPGATLRRQIRRWLADGEVRDARGQHVHVTAHQFRHTLATRMINNDVPLAVIRRLLDHSSTSMTEVYARLNDQTLKREFEKYNQRVNIRGEVIAIDPAGLVSDAAWTKERLARAKQTLPNGYCGLPLQQSCPHPNACLTCDHFLTTEQFLPVHLEQLTETDRMIAEATAQGSERKREMNESVRLNLVRVIEGLQSLTDEADAPQATHVA
ncbi:MAG: tyrosine-type recombinase/integrase [Actinobacteria bacterium]|nr:tyrosine-type recombinase/integrase [Actinomycetota bacterium]